MFAQFTAKFTRTEVDGLMLAGGGPQIVWVENASRCAVISILSEVSVHVPAALIPAVAPRRVIRRVPNAVQLGLTAF